VKNSEIGAHLGGSLIQWHLNVFDGML
jgi:hypothetical protein